MSVDQDFIQLINTAVIKTKEKSIDASYEDRLSKACENPAIAAIGKAIVSLSESEEISRDQAAMMIIDSLRELDKIWNDYVVMEGICLLKKSLQKDH